MKIDPQITQACPGRVDTDFGFIRVRPRRVRGSLRDRRVSHFQNNRSVVADTLTTRHAPTPCGQPYFSLEKGYANDSLPVDELQARIQKIRLTV